LTWKIQDKLAQRDRKHRDIYTRDNKRHLEGMETITRIGETDQGVTENIIYPLIYHVAAKPGMHFFTLKVFG
jgi:hypothetical protein